MLKVLTIADKILILLVVAMSVSSFFLIAALGPEGSVVTVEVNGNRSPRGIAVFCSGRPW